MKSKHLLSIGLLSTLAIGAAAFMIVPKASAASASTSPWAITDDAFEVATMEQFNGGSAYGYSQDRPLGNNSVAGHYYGSYETAVHAKKSYDLMTGVVENPIVWHFSAMRGVYDSTNKITGMKIENNSTDFNICLPEYYSQAEYPDEYAIGQLMLGLGDSNVNRAGAMLSTVPIKNITDITLYWRDSYTRRVYICYQIDGETEWKIYKRLNGDDNLHINGNYTGTRGWDAHGFTTFNSSSWKDEELYGKTAKLAFVIAGKESGSFQLSAVCINANKAAVRYLNTLTYQNNICSDNGENKYFNLKKGESDNVHNQILFQLATELAEGSFLAEYNVVGSKSTETNALSLYNYLVTEIPALGTVKTGSVSRAFISETISNNNNVVIVVSSIVFSAIVFSGFFIFRKQKHE